MGVAGAAYVSHTSVAKSPASQIASVATNSPRRRGTVRQNGEFFRCIKVPSQRTISCHRRRNLPYRGGGATFAKGEPHDALH